MGAWRRVRRSWDYLLSFGAYPDEPDTQRGKRRIVVGVLVFGAVIAVLGAVDSIDRSLPRIAAIDLALAVTSLAGLFALKLKPHRLNWIVNLVFLSLIVNLLLETVMLGGLEQSELIILFGLLAVLGALIVLNLRAAFWWFMTFVTSIVLGAALPNWIEPTYVVEGATSELVTTLISLAALIFVTVAYFVRQRDRLQAESDELLHNILPVQIARRLKSEKRLIADNHKAVSVLFADIVDFTPMSSDLSPTELVGLLNDVFSTFDAFVDELGLEKIKTVGDEYMAAAGAPVPRVDHAHAIADLALRIRDLVATQRFEGHRIRLRIGINSGPVVAGVVGTHKFAYDLWGDVVNMASRMESEGIPGSIQIAPATYELIRNEFVCDAREPITVKGRGQMQTYILRSRL